MGETTGIAWTDHTFNPWMGCTRVSPGCEHCYAEAFVTGRMGLPVWGVDAPRKVTSEAYWKQPARWNKAAAKAGVRRRVFCASLADVFELVPERNVVAAAAMTEARMRLWNVIELTPHLDWLLLTKRPQNIARCVPDWAGNGFPPNVWLGITAEDQQRYDERWPILAALPARVRFISHEPALGPLTLHAAEIHGQFPDWVITGGESGPSARIYRIAWARELVRATRQTGVACFVKQLGARAVGMTGLRYRIKDRKGGDPSEWPPELRVQEFPR